MSYQQRRTLHCSATEENGVCCPKPHLAKISVYTSLFSSLSSNTLQLLRQKASLASSNSGSIRMSAAGIDNRTVPCMHIHHVIASGQRTRRPLPCGRNGAPFTFQGPDDLVELVGLRVLARSVVHDIDVLLVALRTGR